MENFLGINKWHIRLTMDSNLETVEKQIRTLTKTYIICDEISHYHCYCIIQMKKPELITHIKTLFNVKAEKYSCVLVRKPKQMKKYILKDGNYAYNGFTDDEIQILRKCSNKKGTDKFKKELDILEEEYFTSKYNTIHTFATKYVQLKINYGQNIYGNHIKAYILKIKFKKNPLEIHNYVDELLR